MTKPVARAGPWLLGSVCLAVMILASPTLPDASADSVSDAKGILTEVQSASSDVTDIKTYLSKGTGNLSTSATSLRGHLQKALTLLSKTTVENGTYLKRRLTRAKTFADTISRAANGGRRTTLISRCVGRASNQISLAETTLKTMTATSPTAPSSSTGTSGGTAPSSSTGSSGGTAPTSGTGSSTGSSSTTGYGGTVTTGWTTLTASAATVKIHVAGNGNDSNAGTQSAPLKTIKAAIAKVRKGKPDWVLLRNGDSFATEAVYLRKSGKSTSEPIVITGYGTSTVRPKVKSLNFGGKYIKAVSLQAIGPGVNATTNKSKGVQFEYLGTTEDVLLEDILFEGHQVGVDARWVKNLVIRRCVIIDSQKFGMYTQAVDGMLVEDCVWDNNGRTGTYEHDIYHHSGKNTTYKGNIFSRGGNFGLKIRASTENFKIENNLFVRNRNDLIIHLDNDDINKGWTNKNFEVVGNVFTDTGRTGQQMSVIIADADGGLVKDNLIVQSNHADGVAIYLGPGWQKERKLNNLKIVQNTVANVIGRPLVFAGATKATSLTVERNIFCQPKQTKMRPVVNFATLTPFSVKTNLYRSSETANQWFNISGTTYALSDWSKKSGESGASTTDPKFSDATRTVAKYAGSLGLTSTFDAFIKGARAQHKGNWYAAYTPADVNKYMRAGFKPTVSLGSSQVGAVAGN